jgi:thiol-disulfide isomerase/thioredoxin
MFNRSHLLIVVLAIGGALAGLFAGAWLRPMPSTPAANGAKALALGSQRPDIALPDLDGRTRSLSQWDGRLLLVNFWASWCGPCREEMPLLDRTQQRLADRGVQIVGIAADTAEATKGFLGRHPVHYPILVNDPDHGRDVSLDYGDTRGVLPYSVLIDRDGRVLAQRFGSFTEESLQAWLTPHL